MTADSAPSSRPDPRSGLDAVRRDRGLLERLIARIPGYGGLAERDLRREVDQRQREHMATEVHAVKAGLRRVARRLTDAGSLQALGAIGRLETSLDRLAESIRFTDYGASGLFGVQKIREEELEALYRFDLSLLDEIAALRAAADRVAAGPDSERREAVDDLEARLDALHRRWASRRAVIDDIVQTSDGG